MPSGFTPVIAAVSVLARAVERDHFKSTRRAAAERAVRMARKREEA
jgi:hypothetical protein